MKITIYELLGLVKDGKAPKKIKYDNLELEYNEKCKDYYEYYGESLFAYKFTTCNDVLNDEVEIIEEPKKIEKIPLPSFDEFKRMSAEERYVITAKEYDLLDEIIDEINNLKKQMKR